jgi:myo-inositol 2-dehydrogenase/D-chiro-inositol 1-dehydrogenase
VIRIAVAAVHDINAAAAATDAPAFATDAHADLLEQAVAGGKPAPCEKPIDLSLSQVNC